MRGVYVETLIRADVARVWELSQEPRQHLRWDLRFTSIEPRAPTSTGTRRFATAFGCRAESCGARGVGGGAAAARRGRDIRPAVRQ